LEDLCGYFAKKTKKELWGPLIPPTTLPPRESSAQEPRPPGEPPSPPLPSPREPFTYAREHSASLFDTHERGNYTDPYGGDDYTDPDGGGDYTDLNGSGDYTDLNSEVRLMHLSLSLSLSLSLRMEVGGAANGEHAVD
jgi:hypothetical protein